MESFIKTGDKKDTVSNLGFSKINKRVALEEEKYQSINDLEFLIAPRTA